MSASHPKRIERQAVVIIHGMGEQRPMDTLRSFVEGIIFWIKRGNTDRETKPRYWSRPDGISEMYETRRITMQHHEGNPKTDFYEFYWAHHMRNTSFSHLLPWVWKLIKAPADQVPPRLKKLHHAVLRIFSVIAVLVIAVLAAGFLFKDAIAQYLLSIAGLVTIVIFILKVLVWAGKEPFFQIILNTAGDAARYFNPMPSNIEERSSIRREGIAFLRKLHDSTAIKYDRIIVVGHSLGSVVAYDMIRLLWHEMHEKFSPSATPGHDCFREMSTISKKQYPADYTMSAPEISDFQELQHQCWHQYRTNGNNWLISDFITCAGAIAHADYYLLNKPPFAEFINYKEFPASPPVIEGDDTSVLHYMGEKQYTIGTDANGQPVKRSVFPLNHAAPFAVTRWTNIYFSSDYVGSNATRIFRPGIKDIEVPRKGSKLLPDGHTNYWDALSDNEALGHIACAIGFKQVKPPASEDKSDKDDG